MLFAILLFGGLWGFVGMIIGVPLFAVIYDVVKKLVIHGLRRNDELEMLGTYHEAFGDPEEDISAAPEAPPKRRIISRTVYEELPRKGFIPHAAGLCVCYSSMTSRSSGTNRLPWKYCLPSAVYSSLRRAMF